MKINSIISTIVCLAMHGVHGTAFAGEEKSLIGNKKSNMNQKMNKIGYDIQSSEIGLIKNWVTALNKDDVLEIKVQDIKEGWGKLGFGEGLLGGELKIKDRVFSTGLSGHANSEMRLSSPVPLKRIYGFCGIENNKDTVIHKAKTTVTFSVREGATMLWSSHPLGWSSEAEGFDIPLKGQKELTLCATSETPLDYAHIDWGGVVAETVFGEKIYIGQVSLNPSTPLNCLPIDFHYGNETMQEFIKRCGLQRTELNGETLFISSDPDTGMTLEFSVKSDPDFPVCEWHLSFENRGKKETELLSGVKSLCLDFPEWGKHEGRLLRGRGSFDEGRVFSKSFMPVLDVLKDKETIQFGAESGRCSDPWLPFFNYQTPSGGYVFAVGWAGQWNARVSKSHIEAGIESLNARLLPGEKITLPSIHMIRYDGAEQLRGNNILRHYLREKIAPRYGGKPIVPPVCSMAWGGMGEAEHLKRIENIRVKKLPVDIYWIDAGWYAQTSESEHTPEWAKYVGNWSFNPEGYPHGMKPISEAAHRAGLKFLLWVEPERAQTGTDLPTKHPEWFLGKTAVGENLLLNLGNKEACDWCINYVSNLVEKEGLDFYREDFNIAPLSYWRSNDAPDRQGITEIKAVNGLYHFWGELRRRYPKLMIDNCASGGRRIDIELLRFSIPLWASDMQCFPGFDPDDAQTHVSGLSNWLPLFGFGTQNHEGGDTYNFRSNMGAGIGVQLFYQRNWSVSDAYPHEWLRARLEEFHAVKECMSGDFYTLGEEISHSKKVWSISQFDRPDLGCGALFAFRREDSFFTSANVLLKNLQPDAVYEIHDFDSGATWTGKGAELMEKGIRIEMLEARSSRLISYKKHYVK